jgi:hypothetical protein
MDAGLFRPQDRFVVLDDFNLIRGAVPERTDWSG